MVIFGLFAFSAPGLAQDTPPQQVQPRIIVQNGHASPISAAAWTADGMALLTGSTDGQVLVWDLAGRIVNRIALGTQDDRTVVTGIAATPDGKGFEVTQIEFRPLNDNGDASEVHRRHYRIGFGDEHSEPSEEAQIDRPWSADTSFYAGSIALKDALFARSYETVSKLGWTLVRTDGLLAMRPPGPSSSPVPLRGALGFALDQGDAEAEARARRLDEIDQMIARSANGESVSAHNDWDFKLHALSEQGERNVSQRPQFSPDGKRLAWIDPAPSQAPGWDLLILDLDRGMTRSTRFDAPIASARFAWTGPTALLARTAAGDFAVDGGNAAVRPIPSAACVPVAADEIARYEVPGRPDAGAGEHCAPTPPASDARLAVRLSAVKGRVHVAEAIAGNHVCTAYFDEPENPPAALMLASNDKRAILLQHASGGGELFTVSERALQAAASCTGPDCTALPSEGQLRERICSGRSVFEAGPGRAGFHPTLPLLWREGRGGRIDFYLTANTKPDNWGKGLGTPLFTLFRLPDARFFAIDRDGRYDTNLAPDAAAVRWFVSDAPHQSLAPQTFMRDYYQPGLMRRLLECAGAPGQDCASQFPPLRTLASLNRVLPQVEIVGVRPGTSPSQAIVSLKVANGRDDSAPNGKVTTGAYNLRLFRDGALIAQYPKVAVDGDTGDEAAWRERNLVTLDTDGTRHLSLPVELPTGTTAQTIALTAYAFNEDRVKSETARAEYVRPAIASPRPRRAFVVTFGVDDYDDGKLSDLQFAGNDARLLGERLAQIPGYEVRRAIIARDPGSPKPAQITRLTIASVIAILQGVKVEAAKKALKQQGFDASQLDPPTPDDIVILAFSGHGWADKKGGFYLVPADAKWLADGEPDRRSLISAVQMADRLRDVDAGELAMIIDACHSAASVDGGGFKPGPMGDPGLGQLAFDKGIRILAATQADDVALEDPLLRQGLLTYALASEGITATGGLADGDGDGRITLDEWLVYATRRMPSLSTDARLGRLTTDATGARGWVRIGDESKLTIQEPSLFDFNAKPSGVVLKQGVRP